MSKFESIFGNYASNLQVVIDNNLSRFDPTWYSKYFTWAPVQSTLTFNSVIGRARIEAMASVVNRDSRTPLRSRQALERLSGEIPAIKEMFPMSESDYREFLAMQSLSVDDSVKLNQLLDFLFDDTKKVGNAAHKRLDSFVLQGLSNGFIELTVGNNPDGTILTAPVPVGLPADNTANATVSWDTPATATPIKDIVGKKKFMKDKGVAIGKILMSDALFAIFRQTQEVIDTLTSFYYPVAKAGSFSPTAVTTLDKINEYLSAERLPMIEIVEEVTGIEKDGIITPYEAFNPNNAVFIPGGNLGVIKNALAIEQLRPVGKVSYGSFNRALISKWSENEPFGEWTKVELNAYPAIEAIDSVYILKAVY